ncbi:hypothetical protein C8J57DRAFT_1044147, partial [Mycena rebaudengoi]
STERCGLCLNPAPMCEYYTTTSGTKKVDVSRSKCPNAGIKFTYSLAAKSTPSSPCSNVPIDCKLCGTGKPAIWRYNYVHHLRSVHPTAPIEKYFAIWDISVAEKSAMKEVWKSRARGVPIAKKRAPKTAPLVISEAHSSRLSMRYE